MCPSPSKSADVDVHSEVEEQPLLKQEGEVPEPGTAPNLDDVVVGASREVEGTVFIEISESTLETEWSQRGGNRAAKAT